MSMRNMNNRSQAEGLRLKAEEKQRKSFILHPSALSLIFSLLLAVFSSRSYAAQEMLQTSRIKVGEKAPLTETLKKANDEKKVIVLVLLANPMQCNDCEKLIGLLEKKSEPYKNDAVFITAGGQDMLGAASEETIALKKLYGFVTVGESWTFVIDKDGILKKIFMGLLSQQELEGALTSIIEGGKK